MRKMFEKIKALRNAEKTPDEIERLLLSGKLDEIWIGTNGYQFVENLALSWLVVEAHEPGFVEWMWTHPGKYIVHHIDGNKLNNAYSNLQVMSRSKHAWTHRNDQRFTEIEKIRAEKQSKSMKIQYDNSDNKKDNEARIKAMSETKRKNNGWITSESNSELFEGPFTVKDYATVSKISLSSASQRLYSLLQSEEIVCKKELIDGSRRNVYRRMECEKKIGVS